MMSAGEENVNLWLGLSVALWGSVELCLSYPLATFIQIYFFIAIMSALARVFIDRIKPKSTGSRVLAVAVCLFGCYAFYHDVVDHVDPLNSTFQQMWCAFSVVMRFLVPFVITPWVITPWVEREKVRVRRATGQGEKDAKE